MLVTHYLFAQSNMSVVKLKSGAELHGVIKYINPTDALVITIGGMDTSIKMSDVQSVEQMSATKTENNGFTTPLTKEEKLRITDNTDYPDFYDLHVGSNVVRMRLVRGGDMLMGYDGPGSIFMDTEPIHKVSVTSFYMSEEYISNELVNSLNIFNKPIKSKRYCYYAKTWNHLQTVISRIGQVCNISVRMPTEAEWEYAFFSPSQAFFSKDKDYEYCSDYFDLYSNIDNAIDPTGPSTGFRHVIRGLAYKNKCDRSKKARDNKYNCRLVIKAKDIVK